ncbi:MAG: NYN domain-containing protein [Hyphomicrobiales bacterium]|nr:NYN domain-containing protein [Hyphomicrobiales bacterium]
MADTIKSALFVDYDSFHRSLKAAKIDIAESLAQRAADWVAAIESGALVVPAPDKEVRRRTLVRRCYADPRLLEKNRAALIAAGFEVIDCPPLEGRQRNAAEIHMVLDTMDALEHPTGYDEFMLLSADADLTPVLLRLRAHDRATVIFANDVTGTNYKAIADAMIEEAAFTAVLSGEDPTPKPPIEPEPPTPAPKSTAADRSAIEALARKVHGATNVPMLSPRAFADLFRLLTQEIAEQGYHFQKTAENLTNRLAEAGRNVSRRQVLFVVKGLALKGHVFSTSDTPERLAEVFREQVLYLAGSADLQLTEEEIKLLPSWIAGRAAPAKARPSATPAKPLAERAARKPALRRRSPRPAAKPEPEQKENAAEPAKHAEPVGETPKPAEKSRIGSKPVLDRLAEIKATTAARIAARGKSGGSKPPAGPKPTAKPSRTTKKRRPNKAEPKEQDAAAKSAQAEKAATTGDQDELETSILAAIAEAVDVLVEDGEGSPDEKTTTPQADAEPSADVEAEPELEPEASADGDTEPSSEESPAVDPEAESQETQETEETDEAEGDDIGDEIQRIIASYSRARQS